jgi:hypothetical protein
MSGYQARVGSDQNAEASEIAAVPFRKRARLVQLGGASAKLPSSLVKIKPKQLVGASMHLLGIASGLDGRGDFEGIFDQVFASLRFMIDLPARREPLVSGPRLRLLD